MSWRYFRDKSSALIGLLTSSDMNRGVVRGASTAWRWLTRGETGWKAPQDITAEAAAARVSVVFIMLGGNGVD